MKESSTASLINSIALICMYILKLHALLFKENTRLYTCRKGLFLTLGLLASVTLLSPEAAVAQKNVTVCSGGSVTLTATIPQSYKNYAWFRSTDNGQTWVFIVQDTKPPGNVVVSSLPVSNITDSFNNYIYAAGYNNSGGSNYTDYIVTTDNQSRLIVNPTPAAPTATGASRCGTGTVTLTAAGAPAGGSYRWYTVATG
ncbi:immunoglobulin domain-containing protein, partial [Pontibacter aydingkolensis]